MKPGDVICVKKSQIFDFEKKTFRLAMSSSNVWNDYSSGEMSHFTFSPDVAALEVSHRFLVKLLLPACKENNGCCIVMSSTRALDKINYNELFLKCPGELGLLDFAKMESQSSTYQTLERDMSLQERISIKTIDLLIQEPIPDDDKYKGH